MSHSSDLPSLRVLTTREKANLANSAFRRSSLAHVDLVGACLQGSTFEDVELVGVDFAGADLRNVKFHACDLRRAKFSGCHWGQNDFTDSLFSLSSDMTTERMAAIVANGGRFSASPTDRAAAPDGPEPS